MTPTLLQRIRPWFPWIGLIAFAINFARGLTPFVMVEGDEQGVLNGVRELGRAAPDLRWMYLYPLHAGSYTVIRALVALGVPTPDVAFGVATVIGGVGSVILAALLAVRLLHVRWVVAALWLCAIPELSSACFYLNTSAMAGPFAWGALVIACGRATTTRAIIVGLLIALGGWMRVDSLSLAPGVLLLWWRFDQRRAIRATVIAAISAVVALTLFWSASGVGLHSVAEIWTGRDATRPMSEAFRIGLLAMGPVLLMVALAALGRSVARGDWWWLFFVAATVCPTLLAHGHFLTTPKYLYFCLPVLGLAGLGLLLDAGASAAPPVRAAAFGIVALVALDWISALRSWAPERERFQPDAPAATLASAQLAGTSARWVLGCGELIWTDDGYRARGGYWFAPARWHDDKLAMRETRRQVAEFCQQGGPRGVITCGWVARQAAVSVLLENGFSAGPAQLYQPGDLSDYTQDWSAPDGRSCRQVALSVFGQNILHDLLPALAGRETLFLTDQMWRPENRGAINWTPLSKRDDRLVVALRSSLPSVFPASARP